MSVFYRMVAQIPHLYELDAKGEFSDTGNENTGGQNLNPAFI